LFKISQTSGQLFLSFEDSYKSFFFFLKKGKSYFNKSNCPEV
jgi:hypothetical protein